MSITPFSFLKLLYDPLPLPRLRNGVGDTSASSHSTEHLALSGLPEWGIEPFLQPTEAEHSG